MKTRFGGKPNIYRYPTEKFIVQIEKTALLHFQVSNFQNKHLLQNLLQEFLTAALLYANVGRLWLRRRLSFFLSLKKIIKQ
jgi:hypothetical protein